MSTKKLQADLSRERIFYGPPICIPTGVKLTLRGYQLEAEMPLPPCGKVGCSLPAGHEGACGDRGFLVAAAPDDSFADEQKP